jgi:hypothetical protein
MIIETVYHLNRIKNDSVAGFDLLAIKTVHFILKCTYLNVLNFLYVFVVFYSVSDSQYFVIAFGIVLSIGLSYLLLLAFHQIGLLWVSGEMRPVDPNEYTNYTRWNKYQSTFNWIIYYFLDHSHLVPFKNKMF